VSIYFVRFDSLVKIGFTDDLRGRFSALQTGIPVALEFVGHMPGDKAVEAHIHALFSTSRRRGEWFEMDERIGQFIALVLTPGLPAVARKTRTAPLAAASQAEWKAYSGKLRALAAARWPGDTHRHRQLMLVADLGWSNRRVRSLYDDDGYGRLTADERNALDALIDGAFARGVDLPGMVRSREGE
jgi:hypothetical protein